MNNDEFKSWLDNTLVPNVLEGVSKETLISSYSPTLLENSLVESRRVLTTRKRPPPRRKRKVLEEKEDLLNLLFNSDIKDPVMEIVLKTLNEDQINKIKFAHKIYSGYNILNVGVRVGSIEMIEYAQGNGAILNKNSCLLSIKYAQLEVLKFILNYLNGGHYVDPDYREIAAKYGQLEIIKYLYNITTETGKLYFDSCAGSAIENGHLNILEYLVNKGYPLKKRYFINAMEFNQLGIIKYLHKNNLSHYTKLELTSVLYSLKIKDPDMINYLKEYNYI